MNTKEILSIVALAALGLCLLCSLAKAAMKKGDKSKKHCDKACGAFVFLAIILLAVSQLLGEENEKYDTSSKPTTIWCASANNYPQDPADQWCMEGGVKGFPTTCIKNGCTEKATYKNTHKCEICGKGKDAIPWCEDPSSFNCPPT